MPPEKKAVKKRNQINYLQCFMIVIVYCNLSCIIYIVQVAFKAVFYSSTIVCIFAHALHNYNYPFAGLGMHAALN